MAQTRPTSGKDPSGRTQGAQPGHEGRGRELLPTSAVDEVIVHWPSRCDCGREFGEGELVAVGDPVRHQVEELPRLAVTVTEDQCPRVRCPGCGKRARAALPADVAAFEAKLRLLKRTGALADIDAGSETLAEFVEDW